MIQINILMLNWLVKLKTSEFCSAANRWKYFYTFLQCCTSVHTQTVTSLDPLSESGFSYKTACSSTRQLLPESFVHQNEEVKKLFLFIAGRAHHGDGPQSPKVLMGLHLECHQRGTLSHSHIAQVQHRSVIPVLMASTNIWAPHRGEKHRKWSVHKQMGAINIVIVIDWSCTLLRGFCFQSGSYYRLPETHCYKAFMKHEGISTDWCCFFFSVFFESRSCQYQGWSLFIIQSFLNQT